MEYSTPDTSAIRPGLPNSIQSHLIEAPSHPGSEDPIITFSSLPQDDNVVFEDSRFVDPLRSDSHISPEDTASKLTTQSGDARSAKRRTSSNVSHRSTVESIGGQDSEIETVPRDEHESALLSLSHEDDTLLQVRGTEPCLTLHIQMSLHPLTLAEYLWPTTTKGPLQFQHCFHPAISLQILLAILDGVEYLHEQGIVHRDLKPANVFLTMYNKRLRPPGCVDLQSCQDCHSKLGSSYDASPSEDFFKPRYLNIRIGDFGLVAAIARPETEPASETAGKAVGTEFYRPPRSSGIASEKLDVFALGVIAFELLWRFTTSR